MFKNSNTQPRSDLKDIWNSYMLPNTEPEDWSSNDIPFDFTTAKQPPNQMVSFSEAQTLHKKLMRSNKNYPINAFIHCYVDDVKFDGPYNSIWKNPNKLLHIAKHYDGIIEPDFSTYIDFPDPLRRYNLYRMRAFGRYANDLGHKVIVNARWGLPKTWSYDFDGLPTNSMLAIGTVGSGIRCVRNQQLFENGFRELIKRCNPHTLVICGPSNLPIFNEVRKSGIDIIQYNGDTYKRFLKVGTR